MSKKSTVFRLSENFTIRKIDPKAIAIKFFKGEFSTRSLPENKIKNASCLLKFGKDVGNDSNSEVYRFKDKNNNNQTIYTCNHSLYEYSINKSAGKNVELPILKCLYCRRKILKNPIGLPISMEINNEDISFSVVDNFCDFGCVFSYLKRKIGDSRMYRGPLYENAEQILYALYYRVYPDKKGENIKDKPDWDLLRENGGPLTNEEFDSDSYSYIPVPMVNILPVKKQYIKINNN